MIFRGRSLWESAKGCGTQLLWLSKDLEAMSPHSSRRQGRATWSLKRRSQCERNIHNKWMYWFQAWRQRHKLHQHDKNTHTHTHFNQTLIFLISEVSAVRPAGRFCHISHSYPPVLQLFQLAMTKVRIPFFGTRESDPFLSQMIYIQFYPLDHLEWEYGSMKLLEPKVDWCCQLALALSNSKRIPMAFAIARCHIYSLELLGRCRQTFSGKKLGPTWKFFSRMIAVVTNQSLKK